MRAAAMVFATLALTGCSAATAGSGGASDDVITRAEIVETRAHSAFDVVRRLRPQFLRFRGRMDTAPGRTGPGMTEPVVYIDGVRLGGVASLRSIEAVDVAEIRYMSGADATTRFGTGHVAGVILVRTTTGE